MAINWNRRRYSEEEFVHAWKTSLSVAQVASKLNCNKTGGGYKTLTDTALELGLNKKHMTGKAWNVGDRQRKIKESESLETILVFGRRINTSWIKKRLWQEGLLKQRCYICNITEWLDQPAPLALDHINGDNRDNRLENLRILCYNCHGQTETFGRKIRSNS